MNIVNFHNKVAFYSDSSLSPRWKPAQIDMALNSAISTIVLDRYDNIRQKEKKYAFQTAQRLRDELSSIVKRNDSATISGNYVNVQDITDYWLLVGLKANISGEFINTVPLTYDEYNIIELDPFLRPSLSEPKRIYRIESSSGSEILFGDVGSLVSAIAFYIAKPALVKLGDEIKVGDSIVSGTKIVAYFNSVVTISGSAHSLVQGEEYTMSGTGTLTSGIVFKNYVNTDLPDLLHEEIAKTASKVLMGNVENYNRQKSLDEEIKNT